MFLDRDVLKFNFAFKSTNKGIKKLGNKNDWGKEVLTNSNLISLFLWVVILYLASQIHEIF